MRKELQKLVSEWDEALHFQGDTYWKVRSGKEPERFFACLPAIFPYENSILFEGLDMGLTAKSLYGENPARYVCRVACDTLSPVPDSFHVAFTPELAEHLCQIIAHQGMETAFYHFKGYSKTELIFSFHTFRDAFESEVVVSRSIGEAEVQNFADALGETVELATFPSERLTELKKINAIVNPRWWERILKKLAD